MTVDVDSFAAWAHLPRQAGYPVPAHNEGGPDTGWAFARNDVHRQMFLSATQRCGICAHRLDDDPVAVIQAELLDNLPDPLRAEPRPDGSYKIHGPLGQPVDIPTSDGSQHRQCVAMAAALCPALSDPEYQYRGEAWRRDQERRFDDTLAAAGTLDHLNALEAEQHRIGTPVGEHLLVSARAGHLDPTSVLDGGGPIITTVMPPFTFEPIRPWDESMGQPEIDPTDPVPATIVGLTSYAAEALLLLVLGHDYQRNDSCYCNSGKRFRACHDPKRLPQVLRAEMTRARTRSQTDR